MGERELGGKVKPSSKKIKDVSEKLKSHGGKGEGYVRGVGGGDHMKEVKGERSSVT